MFFHLIAPACVSLIQDNTISQKSFLALPRGICFEFKNKSKQILIEAFFLELKVDCEVLLGAGMGEGLSGGGEANRIIVLY